MLIGDLDMAKISVVVPFYKVPYEYIHQCLESILNQTFMDLEIILVDDGSPDDCGKICDEYGEKDKRIIVIHKENGGLSDARNAGITQATSEWITFIDGDDWVETDFFQHFMDRIEKQQELADIYFYSGFRDYPAKEIVGKAHFKDGQRFSSYKEREFLESKCCTIHVEKNGNRKGITISSAWGKMYRLKYLKENSLLFPIVPYDEDSIFYMYAIENASCIEYIATPVYHYRFSENSIVNRYRPNALEEQQIYLSSLFEFAEIYKKSEAFKNKLYMRVMTSMLLMIKQYYFHEQNVASHFTKYKAFCSVIKDTPYKDLFKKVKFSKLGRNAKVKYILLRLRLFGMLEYLRKKNLERTSKAED